MSFNYPSLSDGYYDAPDGQECFKKLKCAIYYTSPIILGLSHAGYFLVRKKIGVVHGFVGITKRFVPLMMGTITMTASMCLITNFRKKDDAWNVIIASLVTATVYGTYRNRLMSGVTVALGLLFFGPFTKLCFKSNMFNLSKREMLDRRIRPNALGYARLDHNYSGPSKYDFSLRKDIPYVPVDQF